MDMSTTTNAVYASMNALADLLEGPENAGKTRIAYHAFIGADVRAFEIACLATGDLGFDGVIGILDPADIEGGVRKVGVALHLGYAVRLQFGRLWLAPGAARAVVVSKGGGKRYGHFAFEDGRFVHRRGWPTQDLARGTERAERRLAELTIQHALAEVA